jgi:hypothetical protein
MFLSCKPLLIGTHAVLLGNSESCIVCSERVLPEHHDHKGKKHSPGSLTKFSYSVRVSQEIGRIRRVDVDHILSFVEEILPTLSHGLGRLSAQKREIDGEVLSYQLHPNLTHPHALFLPYCVRRPSI